MSDRRNFIQNALLFSGLLLLEKPAFSASKKSFAPNLKTPGLDKPFTLYINWAAYDELSDTVKLTEELAFTQIDALQKMRKAGVKVEGYLMDMFWFDIDHGYRKWRKETWSDSGPDRWLNKCKELGIVPGLWFSVNILAVVGTPFLKPVQEWKDSLSSNGTSLCLFSGGYLKHLMETLQMWYDKGVRIFKFDFADFKAATPEIEASLLLSEIVEMNEKSWRTALYTFRAKNPEVMFIAYNGHGGFQSDTGTPFRKSVDTRWLEVYDALYCGDPRPADVPCMNFWRSKDIYSDHMVWQYQKTGIPLSRIDNTAFMVGDTGTCYYRGKASWKSTWLLSMARGGNMHTMYGNLTLFSETDLSFMTTSQLAFRKAVSLGSCTMLGGIPGQEEVYSYLSGRPESGLWTICNPSQKMVSVPVPAEWEKVSNTVLFSDPGFSPTQNKESFTLGPEQVVLVGFGEFAQSKWKLGKSELEFPVPNFIEEISMDWKDKSQGMLGFLKAKKPGTYRLLFKQIKMNGTPLRVSGWSKAGSKSLGQLLKISASIEGVSFPIRQNYDKIIWSGLSWAVAEITVANNQIGKEIQIEFNSPDAISGLVIGKVCFIG